MGRHLTQRAAPPGLDPGGARAGDLAARAVELAWKRPELAARLADEALELARSCNDPEAHTVAMRAAGLAARELHALDRSIACFREALRVAQEAGLPWHAGEARMSLAGSLAVEGDLPQALEEIALALPVLTGPTRSRAKAQRAVLMQLSGRTTEALNDYRSALLVLRRAGHTDAEANVLNNRAMLLVDLAQYNKAMADLLRAESLCPEDDTEFLVMVRRNLGHVAARRGDIANAMQWHQRAEDAAGHDALVDPVGLKDQCDVLLAARLLKEARHVADRAIHELSRRGMVIYLAIAQLVAAEAALLDHDFDVAREQARRARRGFVRQGRPGPAANARLVELRATVGAGRSTKGLLNAAHTVAAELEAAGWTDAALDARLIAARVALNLGHVERARQELQAARSARRHGLASRRARAWHAEALLRLADGDRGGSIAALSAGLRNLDDHRAALGATELRTHATAHGEELALMGLHLALQGGRPGQVWQWAERWRAGVLHMPPARPPSNGPLAAGLTELRGVSHELTKTRVEGGDVSRLERRQASLEREVRHLARLAPGRPGERAAGPCASITEVRASLGESALVEFIEHVGMLHAVTVTAKRVKLHSLGPASEVAHEMHALQFALRRLVRRHGSAAGIAAAEDSAGLSAKRIDALLFDPLGIRDEDLVVVPTGALHAMPWSMLPSCARRSVAVAPSAALWLAARAESAQRSAPPRHQGRVVLVDGPDLEHGGAEVDALVPFYPGARRFSAQTALVGEVTKALDGAGLAHLATHGTFRSDNPLFSSLRLADGPLTVYDLESLRRAPKTVVLSACESGLSLVHPGDELMGLAAALFALRTTTLIASVVPVPDEATRSLMVALHRRMVAGERPSMALAGAQAEIAGLHTASLVAAGGFVCFGAG